MGQPFTRLSLQMRKAPRVAGSRRGLAKVGPEALSPASLLTRILAADALLRRKATFVFALMPGSRDVCLKFANYVGDLPGPQPGTSLLGASVAAAFDAVDPHGVAPYTVAAHLEGFANFCAGMLAHSSYLLSLESVDSRGRTWNPLLGPFSDWCQDAEGAVSVHTVDPSLIPDHLDATVRLYLLSRLLTRHDLPRMVARWPDITRRSAC